VRVRSGWQASSTSDEEGPATSYGRPYLLATTHAHLADTGAGGHADKELRNRRSVEASSSPEQDWGTDRKRWERAEAYGIDHAWTYDHQAWRPLADGPWHATVPTPVGAAMFSYASATSTQTAARPMCATARRA